MAKTRSSGSSKAARRRMRKKRGAIEVRRKREFTYRGYTLEQLREMPFDQLMELLPARARRTYKRGLNEEQKRFVEKMRANEREVLRTHRREIIILPDFVGKRIDVYNGKEFMRVDIKPEMIGHYLGEFALTRKPVKHSGPGVGATRSSKYMPLK
ncbi:MAG: 30S ribosomal protein S19 [Thermoplasmata archaeon]